jgi:HSP20 family protein
MANENPAGTPSEQGKKGQQEASGARQQGSGKGAPSREQRGSEQPSRGLARRESSLPSLFGEGFMGANPFSFMRRMKDDMDRMFESFMPGMSARSGQEVQARGGAPGMWMPRVEVLEREGNLMVRADLPGIRKEDLQIDVTDDALVLRGERRQESEEERGGLYRSEVTYGSFHRAIPLPEGANAENAQARFENGVLEITIPMSQPSRARRIEIQEGKSSSSVH